MDDHFPTEIPGLQAYGVRSGCATFLGSREAMEASGYVPAGTPFPGDRPHMRGSNWRNACGRRWRITKGFCGDGEFRLTVFRTKSEVRVFAAEAHRELLVAQRIARLAQEVDAIPIDASHAVTEFRFLASEHVRSTAAFILSNETIKLHDQDRRNIEQNLRTLAEAVQSACFAYDDASRSSKAAELEQLRARRADRSFNGFLTAMMVEAAS